MKRPVPATPSHHSLCPRQWFQEVTPGWNPSLALVPFQCPWYKTNLLLSLFLHLNVKPQERSRFWRIWKLFHNCGDISKPQTGAAPCMWFLRWTTPLNSLNSWKVSIWKVTTNSTSLFNSLLWHCLVIPGQVWANSKLKITGTEKQLVVTFGLFL